eukprot:SAG25_NODE_1512_length_2866_cov_5.653054_5_plen_51_part_00
MCGGVKYDARTMFVECLISVNTLGLQSLARALSLQLGLELELVLGVRPVD